MTTIFTHLTPPFSYNPGSQQILDAQGNAVLNLAAWHILQHVEDGAKLMDELGQAAAYAMTVEAYRIQGIEDAQKKHDAIVARITSHEKPFNPGCE